MRALRFAVFGAMALLLARSALAEEARAARTVVLFGARPVADPTELVIETVRVHLSDVAGQVGVEPSLGSRPLREQIEGARDATFRHHALGAFWVERSPGRLTLYVYEPSAARVWTSRTRVDAGGESAAAERLAVTARWAFEALIDGRFAELEPLAASPTDAGGSPRDEPTPPPRAGAKQAFAAPAPHPSAPQTAAPGRSDRAYAAVAYAGTLVAPALGWQSGVALSLRGVSSHGFLAGLSYIVVPAARFGTDEIAATLVRHPAEVTVGYRLWEKPFGITVQTSFLVEYSVRTTSHAAVDLDVTPSERRWNLGWSMGGAIDLTLFTPVRMFTLAAADFYPNNYRYVVEGASSQTALAPRWLRPRVEVGVMVNFW